MIIILALTVLVPINSAPVTTDLSVYTSTPNLSERLSGDNPVFVSRDELRSGWNSLFLDELTAVADEATSGRKLHVTSGKITSFKVKRPKGRNRHEKNYTFTCKFVLRQHGRPVNLQNDLPKTRVEVYWHPDNGGETLIGELTYKRYNSDDGVNIYELKKVPSKTVSSAAGKHFRCLAEWKMG